MGATFRLILPLFAVAAAAIFWFWAWLGAPVSMPAGALPPGEKLYCVSYAPFRGTQTPLDPATRIEARQIEQDLAQLSKITGCVRTYSVDYGLDQIPAIAEQHGLKVIQGAWLSSNPDKTREQIEGAVALANKFPSTIIAVVVGNEVLLRGELAAVDIASRLREVKSRIKQPVTYADVWEFWLRNRDLVPVADFITIHILPYWEDFPIAAPIAASHVDAIRAQVANAFPGKEILIGEVGWPSAGRMREGALPSPANQARVIQDVLALAKRGNYRVNVIEAFDQPWKRALEGTVGGHWGLIDDASRAAKFGLGAAVSNHLLWRWQAGLGIAFAALVFGAALRSERTADVPAVKWIAVAVSATVAGALIGWTVENALVESLGAAGWARSLAWCLVALTSAPVCAVAMMRNSPVTRFSYLLAQKIDDVRNRARIACGLVMIALTVLAIMAALGLVFDPRYRDFPFAPMTAAVVPLLALSLTAPKPAGERGVAEIVAAGLLVCSAIYIAFNESIANWQSLWFCASLAVLGVILARVRGEPG